MVCLFPRELCKGTTGNGINHKLIYLLLAERQWLIWNQNLANFKFWKIYKAKYPNPNKPKFSIDGLPFKF